VPYLEVKKGREKDKMKEWPHLSALNVYLNFN
jgi:hypothetical protein